MKALKEYEKQLKNYTDVQNGHFLICKKCEDLEFKMSQLVLLSKTDKSAAKNYKSSESKFSKLIQDKSTTFQKYAEIHEKFNISQASYTQIFNTMKRHNRKRQFEIFQKFSTIFTTVIKGQTVCFSDQLDEEKLSEFLEKIDIDMFFSSKDLVSGSEKLMNYFCFKYLNGITSMKENALVKEIFQLSPFIENPSLFNYLVISFYDRDLSPYLFVKQARTIKGAVYLAVRYLYIMLLSFEDLKKLKNPDDLAEELTNALEEYLNLPQTEIDRDKQFIYYILKVGDLTFWKGASRVSMMGQHHTKYPLLQKFTLKPNSLKQLKTVEFWGIYYRQNNYCCENNLNLFQKMKSYKTKTGIEKKLTEGVNNDDQDLLAKMFTEDGELSKWGVRACSLNDIIRYMVFMNFELEFINKVCDEITSTYNMDKKLAYKVFRETEDEFSLRDYTKNFEDMEEIQVVEEKSLEGVLGVLKGVMQFLTPKESLEVVLVSKEAYEKLSEFYLQNALLYGKFDQETRVKIWWQSVPEKMRTAEELEASAKDADLEIIKLDLHRSTRFFDEKYFEIVQRILMNVALDYPAMSYYQGMNYIAIFLHTTFQDELKAYQFMTYIAHKFLHKKLEKSFKGLMELIFLSDKLIQISNNTVWKKLHKNQISSMMFSVPLIITMFTTYVKIPSNYPFIYTVWDIFLSQGFLGILKAQLCVLKGQEQDLAELDNDSVLMAMKSIEKDPYCVTRFRGLEEEFEERSRFLTKEKIIGYNVDKESYRRLIEHYWIVHQPILKFWSENYRVFN